MRHRQLIGFLGLTAFVAGCGSDATVTAPERTPGETVTGPLLARPAPASSQTIMQDQGGCTFTVTYSWSGFKGRNLIATFGVWERVGGLDFSLDQFSVEGQLGKSGSVSHTFQLTPDVEGSRPVLGRGRLFNGKTFVPIEGTESASSTVSSTCG